MLLTSASCTGAQDAETVPWTSCLCTSPTRYVGVFLVTAHFQSSARVAGSWTLEVGAIFRRRRSWSRMCAIVIAFTFASVSVVEFLMIVLGEVW